MSTSIRVSSAIIVSFLAIALAVPYTLSALTMPKIGESSVNNFSVWPLIGHPTPPTPPTPPAPPTPPIPPTPPASPASLIRIERPEYCWHTIAVPGFSQGLQVLGACEETPEPDPEPEPDNGLLLISEVFYDVDAAHGAETNNEWVEIYNGTAGALDLSGWSVSDAFGSDTLPAGTIVPSSGFLIITATSSTEGFWPDMAEDAVIVVLGSAIGNGLGNGGDTVALKDAGGAEVDAVSWGTNTDAFTPSTSVVAEGNSIARTELDVDTDTAADWEEKDPTPGEPNTVADPL